MSYSDFINTLSYGISLFYDTLVTLSTSLLSNYIVITLLGLSLFSYLFYLLYDFLSYTKFSGGNKKNLDNVRGVK